MSFSRPVVFGNWKMNGLRDIGHALIAELVRQQPRPGAGTLAVFPPTTLLAPLALELDGTSIALGGQDCHGQVAGAFTGDVSAAMLADCGCRYVLVGHSERRQGHGESDAEIRAKATAALDAGLVPVVCIGETEAEWQAGQTLERLGSQLEGSLPPSAGGTNLIVAYEPIWAIGTGRTPKLDDIAATHAFLRERLSESVTGGAAMTLLYGGSVKPGNATDILALANVDGALVGGASLDAADFLAIYKAGVGAAG